MKQKLATLLLLYLLLPFWASLLPVPLQEWSWAWFGGQLLAQSEQREAEKTGFWDQLQAILSKKKEKGAQSLSVTEKYPMYYNWIHREEQKFYDSVSQIGVASWDRYQDIINVEIKRNRDTTLPNKLARNIKVFGWHPYWMGSAYQTYKFEYLSHLAWFSYSVDPYTGKYNNPDVINMWKNSAELFDLAKKSNCKVLLTISSHTGIGNRIFLENPESQRVLIDSLIVLLKGRGDGVDVNFEAIPRRFGAKVTAFLQNLSRRLKAANANYILSVDLPIVDYHDTYQFGLLSGYVDLFLVTGYDFHHVRSKADGPVSPLNPYNGELSIRETVNLYLQKGLSREKLLLGLPYYGALWTARTPVPSQRDSSLKFEEHLTYREIKKRYGTQVPQYDYNRGGAYFITPNADGSYYEKCWFDDTLTLGHKLDWVVEEKLAGIGLWALGYDYGHPDFWNLIEKKLASDTLLVYSGSYIESRQYKLGKSLMAYRSIIGVAGIFLVVFIVGGLVVALFDWRVREVFFQNKTLRLLYSLAAIAVLLSIFAFYLFVRGKPLLDENNLFGLGIGLAAGVCIAYGVGYYYDKWTKNLP
jgi:spore germination protein YaaH